MGVLTTTFPKKKNKTTDGIIKTKVKGFGKFSLHVLFLLKFKNLNLYLHCAINLFKNNIII